MAPVILSEFFAWLTFYLKTLISPCPAIMITEDLAGTAGAGFKNPPKKLFYWPIGAEGAPMK
jgi:hypothetical protein